MKAEYQVCTLEQAKTLKQLGVGNERAATYFVYIPEIKADDSIDREKATLMTDADAWGNVWASLYERERLPAFTVAELGVMCRDCISGHCANRQSYYATPDEYSGYDIDALIGDIEPLPDPLPCYVERPTQAQALADLLIWLLTAGGLTVDEVNQRLAA